MKFLKQFFTWWEGATIGTALFTRRSGERIGTDAVGNVYFRGKKDGKRWVIYKGSNDSGRIPPDWFSWLHHLIDDIPDRALPPVRSFEKPPIGNLTGTVNAYRPAGALERGGQRAAATGDYQAWRPD